MTTAETWKAVAGYEGYYEVSDQGQVRSLDRVIVDMEGRRQRTFAGKVLVAGDNGYGYPVVGLCLNGHREMQRVHSLVAAAFIGPRSAEMEVNHKNGIKTSNNLANLEYVTRGENISHRCHVLGIMPPNNSTFLPGEAHPNSRLTAGQVREIRSRYAAGGVVQQELAREYGVTRSYISMIVNGKAWKHLTKEEVTT